MPSSIRKEVQFIEDWTARIPHGACIAALGVLLLVRLVHRDAGAPILAHAAHTNAVVVFVDVAAAAGIQNNLTTNTQAPPASSPSVTFSKWPLSQRRPPPAATASTPLFFDWELRSIHTRMFGGVTTAPITAAELPVCTPPPGIPPSCCLGSVSHGGGVTWEHVNPGQPKRARLCFDSLAHYAAQAKRANPTLAEQQAALTTRALRLLHRRRGAVKLHGGATFLHLAMTGDSLMAQFGDAAQCAWLREGSTQTVKTLPARARPSWRYGLFEEREYTVTTPPAAGGGGALASAQTTLFLGYHYRPNVTQISELLARTDTIVLNFGLHYLGFEVELMQKEVGAVLRRLHAWVSAAPAEKRMAFWRETTPQHIDSDGGEWPKTIGAAIAVKGLTAHTDICTPLTYSNTTVVHRMWRTQIVRALAAAAGFYIVEVDANTGAVRSSGARAEAAAANGKAPLFWLRIYADLEPEVGMHPVYSSWQQRPFNIDECDVTKMEACSIDGACEPTHFCYSPYVWKGAWAQIVELLEAHRGGEAVQA